VWEHERLCILLHFYCDYIYIFFFSIFYRKASEISRLTEAKSANQPLGLKASVQNIVSLELAANMKGVTIDRVCKEVWGWWKDS
jgi:hypothetical protein